MTYAEFVFGLILLLLALTLAQARKIEIKSRKQEQDVGATHERSANSGRASNSLGNFASS
jgi:hypothetical protein